MVLVEHRTGVRQVELVLGRNAPGQAQEPVQVGADHRRLGRLRVGRAEAFELFVGLVLGLFGEHLGVDHLAVALDLAVDLVGVAELLLNLFHLLAQQVLALGLVHLPLDLGGDLLLHLEERDLVLQELAREAHPLLEVAGLEDLLGLLGLHREVGGHEVREPAAVLEGRGNEHDLRGDLLAELDDLFEVATQRAHERLGLEVALRHGRLLEARDSGLEEGRLLHEVLDACTCQALDEDAHPGVRKLDHPQDSGHRADPVEIVRLRVLLACVALRHQQEQALLGECLVDGGDRLLSTHRQRHHHERKEHGVLQRHHRQDVRNRDRFLVGFLGVGLYLAHGSSSTTSISKTVLRRSAMRGSEISSTPLLKRAVPDP